MAEETQTETEQEIGTSEEDETEGEQEIAEERDWRSEALKQTAIANRLKKKISNLSNQQADTSLITNKPESKIDEELVLDVKILKEERLKRQFGFEHNLSPEETDYAFKFGNGKPTKETLEDSFFKGGLESLRAKVRLEKNIPGSSSRASVFSDKPFTEMTQEERKKEYETKMKRFQK